jgi:hypothetical protein
MRTLLKPALGILCAVAFVGLLVAAPWRLSAEALCAPLHENIEIVASTDAAHV